MEPLAYLDRLAARARRDHPGDGPPSGRFAARVWRKVDNARRRALLAPDPRPLCIWLGAAAVAAGLLL